MVKLFTHTLSIVSRKQTNILSAASIIMMTVALSRVLGLFRDRMLAARFTPDELGVYYAAFRLPNMVFELLVMGSLATAFIPVFTAHLDAKGKDDAFRMASSIINIGFILLLLLSLPIVLFAHRFAPLLAPGFNEAQIEHMVAFTRIMLVAQVFPLLIGNFATGMLQSFRTFLIPAFAPVFYNVGIICAILVLSESFGLYAPVIGVVIGSFLFALVQVPALLSFGYRHSWRLSLSHSGVREVGKLMIPRTLGLAVSQIDITIDLILSTLMGASAVTVFNFAQHLQQVPVGLFGASIAQATLPALASSYTQNKHAQFRHIFISSFLQILFFVLPLSILLIVLRVPMVRLVFGASNLFDWESTVLTGKTLAFFSVSLFAQALIHLVSRGFYAMHDSKTPFFFGAFSVLVNVALSLFFVLYLHWGVWSLSLSTSIASIVYMALLLYVFDKKIAIMDLHEFVLPTLKIFLAGCVAGAALYIPIKLLDTLVFDTTRTFNLFVLTGISTSLGLAVYLFLAWFLEIPQMTIIAKLFKRARLLKKGVVIETVQEMN